MLLLFCCVLMILLVLMQRPKQEGLGAAFGGGMTDSLLGAGTTNFLQKATVYLAVAFFILSAGLAIMVSKKQRGADAIPLPAALETQVTAPEGTTPPIEGGAAPADLPGEMPAEVPTQLPAEVPTPETGGEPTPAEPVEPAPEETPSEPAPVEGEPEPSGEEPAPEEGGEENN